MIENELKKLEVRSPKLYSIAEATEDERKLEALAELYY